jgi:hypothetical protein
MVLNIFQFPAINGILFIFAISYQKTPLAEHAETAEEKEQKPLLVSSR